LIPLIKEIQFQFHEESDSQETLMSAGTGLCYIASPSHSITSSLLRARKQHRKKSNALFT